MGRSKFLHFYLNRMASDDAAKKKPELVWMVEASGTKFYAHSYNEAGDAILE